MSGKGIAVPEKLEIQHEIISSLEKKLKYDFKFKKILLQSLTHSSRANEEDRPGQDNESLEFLGDSVLSFLVADLLWKSYPGMPVGELSHLRSCLVSEESLARRARVLGLSRFLLLGKSERVGGGPRKPSLLADAYEAILAAIYLDGGLDPVREFIHREFRYRLRVLRRTEHVGRDPKTVLQEWLQSKGKDLPTYRLVSQEGPPHDRRFSVVLEVDGRPMGKGTGRSKKLAERQAAGVALKRLDRRAGKKKN
ncbi:MAG: ribonuclease III [Acidobacteriota bacterium]